MRKRKWEDEYVVQGNYGSGWEDVNANETLHDGKRSVKEYRENEPQYSHRLIKRRVRVGSGSFISRSNKIKMSLKIPNRKIKMHF